MARKKSAELSQEEKSTIPHGQPEDIEPHRLLLDPLNLRLMENSDRSIENTPTDLYAEESIQSRLYETLIESSTFDVKSLADSIRHNGFLSYERLIVCPYDSQHFLVLEGNRRLTAVRFLLKTQGSKLDSLSRMARNSIATLPCYVLGTPPVNKSPSHMKKARLGAEVYIGLRHLMGPKGWEPASRYEFQARLVLDEKWEIEDVARRFGRTPSQVRRDLKAQRLYHDFREYEDSIGKTHTPTYNFFAEVARAIAISDWLGWSDASLAVTNKRREHVLFDFARSRIQQDTAPTDADESAARRSAEDFVRNLRDMLKLNDEEVTEALDAGDLELAEAIFTEKRQGDLARRIASYCRAIKRAHLSEIEENKVDLAAQLEQLIDAAQKLLSKVK